MAIIIVIIVGLAAIFKQELLDLVTLLFDKINTDITAI
jgi:hypothetical protein